MQTKIQDHLEEIGLLEATEMSAKDTEDQEGGRETPMRTAYERD